LGRERLHLPQLPRARSSTALEVDDSFRSRVRGRIEGRREDAMLEVLERQTKLTANQW
jgi:hypothetical protein